MGFLTNARGGQPQPFLGLRPRPAARKPGRFTPRLELLEDRCVPAGLATTPTQNVVNQLYQDFLGRQAEQAGLTFWANQISSGNQSATQVASAIENSQEGRTFAVNSLYQAYLHRSADQGGLNGYTQFLGNNNNNNDDSDDNDHNNNGNNNNNGDNNNGSGNLSQLRAILLSSPEYFANRGGGTNTGWLNAVYQDLLGRPVEAGALTNYTNLLNGGTSRQQIVTGILNSQEYRTDLIDQAYTDLLRRPADQGGANFWLNQQNNGQSQENLYAAFAGSPEYGQLANAATAAATTNLYFGSAGTGLIPLSH